MLDSLRAFSRTWYAKVFFAVLIVSFGAFGISNVVTGIGSTTVARVGNEDISAADFTRAYQQQLEAVAQQRGQMLTDQQALALGIPGGVLLRLANEAAIDQVAKSLGVGVSNPRLSKLLRDDPSFFGTLGTFDEANFQRVLQQNNITDSQYFDLQAKAARRQQLAAALLADSVAPNAAIELTNRYYGDTRTIEYVVLNAAGLPPVAAPTDEELQAYLTEHQADYRTTETRTADILVLSPDTIAAANPATDEEIAAEYEKQKATLTRPEKRTIKQVVLTDPAAIEAFTSGKAAGKTFDQLVAETGASVTELGTVGKSEVLDPTVASTAFSLALNDFALIPGIGGKRVVAVTAIEGGGTPALDEVKADIARQIATGKARTGYLEMLDQIEELRAAFQPLADIAKRFGLAVTQVKVTATGAELEAVSAIPAENRAKVAQSIFAADPAAKLTPTVSLGSTFNVWFDVKGTDPAHDQTLDEVRDQITAAWTAEKTEAALAAEVEAMTADLKAGKAFADVVTARSLFPQLSQPISRQGDGTPVLDQGVATAAFAGGIDHYGSAKNGDGDYVVFHVVDIVPGVDNPAAKPALEASTRDTLYADFVNSVRNDIGVRENGAVLNQILNLTPGS